MILEIEIIWVECDDSGDTNHLGDSNDFGDSNSNDFGDSNVSNDIGR